MTDGSVKNGLITIRIISIVSLFLGHPVHLGLDREKYISDSIDGYSFVSITVIFGGMFSYLARSNASSNSPLRSTALNA